MPKRKVTTTGATSTGMDRKNQKKSKTKTKIKTDKNFALPYYQGSSTSGPTPVQQNIRKVFDTYKDKDDVDKIGMDGTMSYLKDLHIELDEVVVMAIFEQLQSPAMAEFDREPFITGWQNASSASNPCDTVDRQSQYVNLLRQKLLNDPAYFKQVYKSAFKYAKPDGQRAVPVSDAFAYWEMFFRKGKGGIEWNSTNTAWMDLWLEFYKEKNNRPVNKDLWNQFCELVAKTRENGGESLDWWSEDGAWPTAVDDFVAFVRQKRQSSNAMDTK